jgi:acetoacetate decarboxylase
MLKGFNYPLTPKGKSTLNPRPPWYYSADFLSIEFWSDPSAVAAVLPPGVDPDSVANGHGNALFYDWQFSGDNEEYLDPARYQYREFFLLVDALYEGKAVSYCPYIFVDNDAAIARGWTQGYPKWLGQVFQTRYYAATGKAGPALARGSKFAGSLTAAGQGAHPAAQRLAEALVTLKEPVTDPSLLKQRPIVNLLHCPGLAADRQDEPAIHELVENVPDDLKIEQAWIGEGSLTLPSCRGEELSDLAPVRCDKGIRTSMAYVVDDLRTLRDLSK